MKAFRGIICAFALTIFLPMISSRAGVYDASNGVFGSGSYVGSDHWFASFTSSALIQAAGRNGARANGSSSSSSGSATSDIAREDAERGYFRIDPTRTKYSSTMRTDGDWIRPVPDGSFQRPVTDGSWKPPAAGPGYVAPQSDNSWKAPTTGPGYVAPQSDNSWKAPQSDNSWRSPTVGPGYVPPGSVTVTLGSGDDAVSRHDLPSAIENYRAAIGEVESEAPSVRAAAFCRLGVALLAEKRPAEASTYLAQAARVSPDNPFYRLLYGASLFFQGYAAQAEREFSASASHRSADGLAFLLLGISREVQGDKAQAEEAYRRYLKFGPAADVNTHLGQLTASATPEATGAIGVSIERVVPANGGASSCKVLDVAAGGPADKAGIRAGDFILSVNGISTAGMEQQSVASALRGPIGEAVALTIMHRGATQARSLRIARADFAPLARQLQLQKEAASTTTAPTSANASVATQLSGTYANLSYNVDGAGGANRGMPWLYIMDDGSYRWGRETGTWKYADGGIIFSGSYASWGTARVNSDKQLLFDFTKGGKHYIVTMYYRGTLADYPPPG